MDESKTVGCICRKQGCWRGSEEKVPEYCQANNYRDEIQAACGDYTQPEMAAIYKAACVVGAVNDGYRPRIAEAVDFAQQMGFSKIGFAACTAFSSELAIITKLFAAAGLKTVTAGCTIGGKSAEARGLPELKGYVNSACNPLAQAAILNKAGTQLNFIVGLCMGHDMLFTQRSDALVSTLIVKDRLMGNNPAAALYGYHARRSLFNLNRSNPEMV